MGGSWGYRHGFDWEDLFAGGLLAVFVIAAAVLITILIAVCMEIGRLHQQLWPSGARGWLVTADAVLLAVWLVGASLVATPGGEALGAYLAAWGFLVYVIVLEVVAQRATVDEPDLRELDSYLGPFTSAEPSVNGHANIPAGTRS